MPAKCIFNLLKSHISGLAEAEAQNARAVAPQDSTAVDSVPKSYLLTEQGTQWVYVIFDDLHRSTGIQLLTWITCA
jgi:hypothetical protein